MKLYFAPGACSLSPHIVLREAGQAFELEKVDLRAGQTAGGADFKEINPKGYVPTLQLADGKVLTEGPAIVQYIADQHPEARIAPPNGTFERAQLQEWLNFISTELHKQYSPLFNPASTDAEKERQKATISRRLTYISSQLEGKDYLLGNFSVADAYLFTVLRWSGWVKLDLSPFPVVQAYMARVATRPAVHAAMKAEGLPV